MNISNERKHRSRVEGSRQVSELFGYPSVFAYLLLCILKFSFVFALLLSKQAIPLVLLFFQAVQQLVLFIFNHGKLIRYVLRIILQFFKSLNQIVIAFFLLADLCLLLPHDLLYFNELLLKSIVNLASFIQVLVFFLKSIVLFLQ